MYSVTDPVFVRIFKGKQSNYSNYVFTIRYLHSMPLAYYITYYYITFIPGVLLFSFLVTSFMDISSLL